MKIIPAIDLINNSCVRLVEGDYERKTEYHTNPVEQALDFERLGFKRLHVVDLDGARNGSPVHLSILKGIADKSSLIIDFGGGVRERSQVADILTAGASMVSLGSIAVNDAPLVKKWIREFGPDKFFLGADVIDGYIATQAWKNTTDMPVSDFIRYWRDQGIRSFFSTDVRRDGRLEGPALSLYKQLMQDFQDIELVASGGVGSVDDLVDLAELGMPGVIVGKAFYEGRISYNDLKQWM